MAILCGGRGGGTQHVGATEGRLGSCLSHRGTVPPGVLRRDRARVALRVPGTLGP